MDKEGSGSIKVWVIGRAIPTKENNMEGSFEMEQAQMLVRHGCEVYYPVIDVRPVRSHSRLGLKKNELNGVTTLRFSVPLPSLLPPRVTGRLITVLREKLFRKMVSEYGLPDVIHVHYPSLYSHRAFTSIQKRGVKLVCTEHWTKVQEKKITAKQVRNLANYVNNCDAMLCVGERLARSVIELTGTDRDIQVVPNIVSDLFAYLPGDKTDKLFRFVGVGRIVACKRFDLQIKAFAQEFKGDKRFRLDIIGAGEEYDLLKKLIHECGCDEQISLLGIMNRKEVAEYYHKCNVLVMSSNLETFGVPIIEAMASGLPVITTDAMGFPSLFHEEQGYMIPADDQESLAKAMRQIVTEYSRFDREMISKYAMKEFGEDAVFKQLESIYGGSNLKASSAR